MPAHSPRPRSHLPPPNSATRPPARFPATIDRARRRFPRLLPVLANLAVVAPLLAVAVLASFREQTLAPRALLAELAGVQEDAALVLLVYAVWLGWSPRASAASYLSG